MTSQTTGYRPPVSAHASGPWVIQYAVAYDSVLVGRYINALREQGTIQPGDRILLEVVFWDYILLHTLSNDPGAVIYDRQPIPVRDEQDRFIGYEVHNPSLLAGAPAHLAATQAFHQIPLVVAHSDQAVADRTAIAQETFHAGRFHVFLVAHIQEIP